MGPDHAPLRSGDAAATGPMVPRRVELDGQSTPSKDRASLVLDHGGLRITAIEVDHAPIAPAYGYRFHYKGSMFLVRRRG